MWKTIPFSFLFLSVAFFSCDQKTQNDISSMQEDISRVLFDQANAWNEGNIRGFMEGYERSDSLQFITRRGRTTGWNNVLNRYLTGYPSKKEMGTLNFTNLMVKPLSADIAQVYGNWQVVADTTTQGHFSLIVRKHKKAWKIAIDHTW